MAEFRTRARGYGAAWTTTAADSEREAAIEQARPLGEDGRFGVTIEVEYGWSWRVREVSGELLAVVSIDSAKALARRWRWERASSAKRVKMSRALMPTGYLGLIGIFSWGPAAEPALGDDVEFLRDWVREQERQLGAAAGLVLATMIEVELGLDHEDAEALVREMLGGQAR